jgi:hypothetical protein
MLAKVTLTYENAAPEQGCATIRARDVQISNITVKGHPKHMVLRYSNLVYLQITLHSTESSKRVGCSKYEIHLQYGEHGSVAEEIHDKGPM